MDYQKCARLLKQKDNILLVTHRNPDGDCMGSAAALCCALRRAGKTAYLYPNPQVIKKLRPFVEPYFAPEGFVAEFTVAVDVATEYMFANGFEGEVDLCIDHHPTNSLYAKQSLIRAEKSSCGEVVMRVVKNICGDISKTEANLLYIALTTDCGCFQYANTNAATLSAGAELIRCGAENHRISEIFFRKISRGRMKLEGMIYDGMEFYRDGKLCVAIISQEMMALSGATDDDCDDLSGITGRSETGEMSVTIRETKDGKSKVSVRSNPGISSKNVCLVFGGGGHELAAGCTIDSAPQKAKEMLLAVIDEVWK